MGHSYWMTFTWFIPLLVTSYFSYKEQFSYPFILALFFSMLFKIAMGYEYILVIGTAAILPVLYFSIKREWAWYLI